MKFGKLCVFVTFGLFVTGIVTGSIGPFHKVQLSGPSSIDINVDEVFYRNGTLIGEASSVDGNLSIFRGVSFKPSGEVNWEKDLSKNGERLVNFGGVFDRYIGAVYNESIEAYNSEGEKIRTLNRENGRTTGRILKARIKDSSTYIGGTKLNRNSIGMNLTVEKYIGNNTDWKRGLPGGKVGGGHYPYIADLKVTENGSVIVAAAGSIEGQEREVEARGNPTTPDFDWKVFRLSSQGELLWEKEASSMQGPDEPLNLELRDEKIAVTGTFPEGEMLKKAVYGLDGEEVSDREIGLHGSVSGENGIVSQDTEYRNDYEDEYMVFRNYSFTGETGKTEVLYSEFEEQVQNASKLGNPRVSSPELVSADEKTFLMANTGSFNRSTDETYIAEVKFEQSEDSESFLKAITSFLSGFF